MTIESLREHIKSQEAKEAETESKINLNAADRILLTVLDKDITESLYHLKRLKEQTL